MLLLYIYISPFPFTYSHSSLHRSPHLPSSLSHLLPFSLRHPFPPLSLPCSLNSQIFLILYPLGRKTFSLKMDCLKDSYLSFEITSNVEGRMRNCLSSHFSTFVITMQNIRVVCQLSLPFV